MEEEDEAMGIPEWVVTFGDMMSLLLTFFIMLVSMSEIKEEEKFQAVVEALRRQLAHDKSPNSLTPGDHKVRSVQNAIQATLSRAKKKDTHKGGVPTKAPHGEEERVRIIRPGRNTAIGTVIFFEDGASGLNEKSKADLDLEIVQLLGKPQKIEIRGHSRQELASDPNAAMNLGYTRARAVFDYLTEKHEVAPDRMRCVSAGASEPMHKSNDPEKMKKNQRVEIFLLEETVDEIQGTEQERSQQILEDPTAN